MTKLSVFEKYQLAIARKTLTCRAGWSGYHTDAGAFIMGGPTKKESREFIDKMKREGKIRR